MSKMSAARHDPIPIGNISEPPFVRLPDPSTLFQVRAQRFDELSGQHDLAPFLKFLSGISSCQHQLQVGLPDADLPSDEARERAREHGMPPLDRSRFTLDAAFDATLGRLLHLASAIDMPDDARSALTRVAQAGPEVPTVMARAVLEHAVPVERFADHVFVAAALQVHYARLASRLDPKRLVPVGDGACPSCGGAPTASLVVGWPGAENARFCACSVCSTLWNYVRIKCTVCGSTKGISYREIEGGGGTVWAETCDSCHSYVKILHQHKNPGLDPVADDVASLGLDLLVREDGYRRGSINPFLLGY